MPLKIPMNSIGIRHLAIRLNAIANSLENNAENYCNDYSETSHRLNECVKPLNDLIEHFSLEECGGCSLCDY